jgi:hypothetical protein
MELLTPDQLAVWLQVTRRSVYELCSERGQHKQTTPLPHLKVAGKLRFNKAAVAGWLQELEKTV